MDGSIYRGHKIMALNQKKALEFIVKKLWIIVQADISMLEI